MGEDPKPGVEPTDPRVHLAYATPQPTNGGDMARRWTLYIMRRVLFAVGVGLLMFGMGEGCATVRGDAPEFIGTGAALIALVIPWGWRRIRPGRIEN